MADVVEISMLFDFYGTLLTENQQRCIELYYSNDMSFAEWLELDLKYIQERSFWEDWKIIVKTFGAVLGMEGE